VFKSFVIFAEMRTGSNFLEANLNRLSGVKCHGEAFNPYFIGGENKQAAFGIDLAGRDADPSGFLRAMRAQTDGLAGFRYFHDHDPRVPDLVLDDASCAKIILTRNPLESYISWKIAVEADQWWLANTRHLRTPRPRFDLVEFKTRSRAVQEFQVRLLRRLQVTGQTAFYVDYADVLDLDVLNGLAQFLGVSARLRALDTKFKKQNPEALRDKVSNPEEMEAALARIDWFEAAHTPNFEPRRNAGVPHYIAPDGAGLLFQPIKGGPEANLRHWLAGFGPLQTGFERRSLRIWKDRHPRFRSFTVLRHPLARAHAAFCDYLAEDWLPELRPYLKRVHRFDLPPRAKGFADAESFRAGFKVFLDFARFNLTGRTEIKVMPHVASQLAVTQGFAAVQAPDMTFREDRLAEGLAFLTANLGLPCPTLPPDPEPRPFSLQAIWGPDLEEAAEAAYARDYAAFGFARWRD